MWERSGHKGGTVRVPEVRREQRYIFNGEPSAAVTGYAVRQNRRTARPTFSIFNVILAVFTLGFLVVVYIHNIIEVNRLVVEVTSLEERIQRQTDANKTLQAEVNSKASLDRIGTSASEMLGMSYPQEQPQWFVIDADLHDRADRVREELGE